MSLSIARPYRKPPIDVPPYPFYGVRSEHLNENTPDAALKAALSAQMASNVTGDTLTLNIVAGSWGYLMSPVSNGAITFLDISPSGGGGATGGWDGASWPADGRVGDTRGPVVVTLDFGAGEEEWYLYRTDFQGLGNRTYRLTYARNQF